MCANHVDSSQRLIVRNSEFSYNRAESSINVGNGGKGGAVSLLLPHEISPKPQFHVEFENTNFRANEAAISGGGFATISTEKPAFLYVMVNMIFNNTHFLSNRAGRGVHNLDIDAAKLVIDRSTIVSSESSQSISLTSFASPTLGVPLEIANSIVACEGLILRSRSTQGTFIGRKGVLFNVWCDSCKPHTFSRAEDEIVFDAIGNFTRKSPAPKCLPVRYS